MRAYLGPRFITACHACLASMPNGLECRLYEQDILCLECTVGFRIFEFSGRVWVSFSSATPPSGTRVVRAESHC